MTTLERRVWAAAFAQAMLEGRKRLGPNVGPWEAAEHADWVVQKLRERKDERPESGEVV